jgi:UDP-glucose 4-epimerase
VVQAAIDVGISKMILLSTDKAVYPINAMGISKAMAEKIVIAQSRELRERTSPVLCITRYGNVMASRGSVIPMFIERIKAGQEILITDPRMTRFLMSLGESVELVVQAFQNGKQGDIFVQKSPACTIQDLAIALCELFDAPVKSRLIGSRHGEKLFETLLSKEEKTKAMDLGRYWRVPADDRNLNYESFISNGVLASIENDDYNSHNTLRLTVNEIKDLLVTLPLVQEELESWRGKIR